MKKYFYIFILFFIQATVLSCTDEEIYESPTDGKSSIKITLNVPVDNGKTRGLIYGPDEVPVDGESEIKDIYVLAFDKESKSYLGKFQSYITNNTLVATFTLAVNRRFVKENEERQADFIPIIAWSKTGEFCNQYFKKGQQVGIVGRIQTRNWDDEQGIKHYATEVIAEEVYFADTKKDVFTEYGSTFANNTGNDFDITSGDDLPF